MTTPPSSLVVDTISFCYDYPLKKQTDYRMQNRWTYPTDELTDDTVPATSDVRIFVTISVVLDFT